jgi:hypothetical protein
MSASAGSGWFGASIEAFQISKHFLCQAASVTHLDQEKKVVKELIYTTVAL